MRRFLMLTVIGGCAVGLCLGEDQRPRTLDLCTIAANIRALNGQQIRVTAFLGAGAEQDVLYDPKCQQGKPLVYVSFKSKVSGQMKALRRIVAKRRYAYVTVEGTMHGPEPVRIDPKLPDWLKDRFKGSSSRYGHLDSLEMMIEIARIIEVKEVDDGLSPERGSDGDGNSVVPLHEMQRNTSGPATTPAARAGLHLSIQSCPPFLSLNTSGGHKAGTCMHMR